MDEAPGVADRELILSGMLVCSTASGQDAQKIVHEKAAGRSVANISSAIIMRRRPIAERRYAFAFCRDHLTELYATERGPPWKAAFRLSSHSPGARLGT